MFFTLLLATFALAVVTSLLAARGFAGPIDRILGRIVSAEMAVAWKKYLQFAILVVGVSAGVRIHDLERYITPSPRLEGAEVLTLTAERWTLEIYRTVIGALQGIAWMLLVFFVVALVAYVIVRIAEMRHEGSGDRVRGDTVTG